MYFLTNNVYMAQLGLSSTPRLNLALKKGLASYVCHVFQPLIASIGAWIFSTPVRPLKGMLRTIIIIM